MSRLVIKTPWPIIKMFLKIKVLRLFFLVILSVFSNVSIASNERVYTVGVVPQFETRKLHAIWRPVLNRLEQETGYKFILKGSPAIPVFEKEFLAGKFDFIYMNPYHLAWSHEKAGYKPLVRDHSRQLHGVLVVRNDSTITSVKQLKGKKIAFPAVNALGASLMIQAELLNRRNIKIIPKYVKTHDSVYLNVFLKQVAAGGGVKKTLDRQKPSIKNKLRILYRTDKVAPHPFASHPRVAGDVALKVKKALLNMENSDSGKKLLSKIPIKKIGVATMDDYLPLTKMGLEKIRAE